MIKRRIWIGMLCLLLAIAVGCESVPPEAAATPEPTALPTASPEPVEEPELTLAPVAADTPVPEPTAEPTEAPTPEPTPEPTPVPTPATVTLGAVGDIMVPSGIVSDVRKSADVYDFSTLFAPMRELFESVDLMCGNLETPLAGAEAGYSQRRESGQLIYFNAPDSLLDTLKEYGVDMLTTANNHAFDKGRNGVFRTIEKVREAGFYQTGTFLDEADRERPLIVEINGMRLGFIAATRLMNKATDDFSRKEARTVAGFMDGQEPCEELLADIERTRAAGAEFIILFAHWDFETDSPVDGDTRKMAAKLLKAGVDCIIGSHPHRIKGAEYVTVERKTGPYTGLVLYSLGNFSANSDFNCMVGLFAKITLEKDFVTNTITLTDAAVQPTFVLRRGNRNVMSMTIVPTYTDAKRITGLSDSLSSKEIASVQRARELALKRFGTVEGVRLLEESNP